MSRRKACAAYFCASPPLSASAAARMAFQASSGNLASMTSEGAVVRHLHETVRPGAVRQRRLELVGAVRQAVGDDRLHARLAEGAARLLVGEDRLQLHDLAGERLDVVLRIVDDGEPLLQLGERCHASTWSARSWSGRSGRSWRRAAGRSTGSSSACRAPNTSATAPSRPCISACACTIAAMRASASRAWSAASAAAAARARAERHSATASATNECAEQKCAEAQRLAERNRGRAQAGDRLGENRCQLVHRASIADSADLARSKREQMSMLTLQLRGLR